MEFLGLATVVVTILRSVLVGRGIPFVKILVPIIQTAQQVSRWSGIVWIHDLNSRGLRGGFLHPNKSWNAEEVVDLLHIVLELGPLRAATIGDVLLQ